MSVETRTRSESMVSVDGDEADFEPIDSTVMDEDLVLALQEDDIEAVKKADAAELEKPTIAKTWAMHEACENGSMRVVKYLVESCGHDVDVRDFQQWTPLHYAAAFQDEDDAGVEGELVHYLLSHGADASAEDEDGDTPLDAHTEEVDADADEPTFVSRILESVVESGDYETWAKAHARAPLYTTYVQSSRPQYVKNALRHEWALLHVQTERSTTERPRSAASFVLGQHGGNAVFHHLLPFLA